MSNKYKKLVRDFIPEIIKEGGEFPEIRILNDKEYSIELFRKLEEETKELIESKNDRNELVKEIGDVYEVIDAIIDKYNLDKEEILKVKQERKEKRGGFKKKIYLEDVLE